MMKKSLILLAAWLAVVTANALAGDVPIGFIYVGPKDDYGYNQAHVLGAASVAKLPGVKIVEEANVPETVAVQETMRDMIVQDNAPVLFPTSFGYYDPHGCARRVSLPEALSPGLEAPTFPYFTRAAGTNACRAAGG